MNSKNQAICNEMKETLDELVKVKPNLLESDLSSNVLNNEKFLVEHPIGKLFGFINKNVKKRKGQKAVKDKIKQYFQSLQSEIVKNNDSALHAAMTSIECTPEAFHVDNKHMKNTKALQAYYDFFKQSRVIHCEDVGSLKYPIVDIDGTTHCMSLSDYRGQVFLTSRKSGHVEAAKQFHQEILLCKHWKPSNRRHFTQNNVKVGVINMNEIHFKYVDPSESFIGINRYPSSTGFGDQISFASKPIRQPKNLLDTLYGIGSTTPVLQHGKTHCSFGRYHAVGKHSTYNHINKIFGEQNSFIITIHFLPFF